jgi:hypothetical protein
MDLWFTSPILSDNLYTLKITAIGKREDVTENTFKEIEKRRKVSM